MSVVMQEPEKSGKPRLVEIERGFGWKEYWVKNLVARVVKISRVKRND
jgi:hypothetical protein